MPPLRGRDPRHLRAANVAISVHERKWVHAAPRLGWVGILVGKNIVQNCSLPCKRKMIVKGEICWYGSIQLPIHASIQKGIHDNG